LDSSVYIPKAATHSRKGSRQLCPSRRCGRSRPSSRHCRNKSTESGCDGICRGVGCKLHKSNGIGGDGSGLDPGPGRGVEKRRSIVWTVEHSNVVEGGQINAREGHGDVRGWVWSAHNPSTAGVGVINSVAWVGLDRHCSICCCVDLLCAIAGSINVYNRSSTGGALSKSHDNRRSVLEREGNGCPGGVHFAGEEGTSETGMDRIHRYNPQSVITLNEVHCLSRGVCRRRK